MSNYFTHLTIFSKFNIKSMKKLLPIIILLVVLVSCQKQNDGLIEQSSLPARNYSGKFVRDYFTLMCKISKTTPGFFPPQVARAYGYVGLANYEAVVPGIRNSYTLAGQINGLKQYRFPVPVNEYEYDWSIASNAAMSDMIRKMFEIKISAANLASIDSAENVNLAIMSQGRKADVIKRSVEFGKSIAATIYNYSLDDGCHHAYLDPFQLPYTMPPDPGCWVPTGALLTPISPYWGNSRPFLEQSVTVAQQYVPVPFSTSPTSDFYKQALAVYNQVKFGNTPEKITIAKYWSDDPFNTCTPTGHTFNIMSQLLLENNATLEKTSVAYAKLSVAEMDAFISCWKLKYKYLLMRPVTYIKQNIDNTFTTVLGSPAFPAFTSGHSCEMGAGAQIFNEMFTDGSGNYKFTDYSQVQYGFAPRSYTNFNAMADECANSRLYGGIHYPMDNILGLEQGKKIGDNVNQLISWPQNTR